MNYLDALQELRAMSRQFVTKPDNSFSRIVDAIEREVAYLKELASTAVRQGNKQADMAAASAHVVVEAGIVPGVDYGCRCDECRSVARSMAEAGYLDKVQDRWWERK